MTKECQTRWVNISRHLVYSTFNKTFIIELPAAWYQYHAEKLRWVMKYWIWRVRWKILFKKYKAFKQAAIDRFDHWLTGLVIKLWQKSIVEMYKKLCARIAFQREDKLDKLHGYQVAEKAMQRYNEKIKWITYPLPEDTFPDVDKETNRYFPAKPRVPDVEKTKPKGLWVMASSTHPQKVFLMLWMEW